jgi:hypothetical protein
MQQVSLARGECPVGAKDAHGIAAPSEPAWPYHREFLILGGVDRHEPDAVAVGFEPGS